MAARLKSILAQVWQTLRELSGDDAYERYLSHHTASHPELPAMRRDEFFRYREKAKWDGIRRCC